MRIVLAFVSGIVVGLLLLVLGVLGYLGTGGFNTAATARPSGLEEELSDLALERSIKKRSPREGKSPEPTPEVLEEGLAHYRVNCLPCHGAPGVARSDMGMGLNPAAPDLTLESIRVRPDGELFWIVGQGIRMTGMPAFSLTHGEEDIWEIVAFVRHLPDLTEEERAILKAQQSEAEQQHHPHGAPKKADHDH